MNKKPFWAYDLEETLTEESAEQIANAIFRAWTGEDLPPKEKSGDAAENVADHRPF